MIEKTEASTRNADIKSFVAKTQPGLRKHLQMMQDLQQRHSSGAH